jgi:amino acid permease
MQCKNFVSGMPVLFGRIMITGGPQAAFTLWTIVGIVSRALSFSLAEITATFPTPGDI